MAMADVTVMGAGIFGLSVAWCCIRRGARVRVIDPGGPGAGASGGIVGALAPHVPEQWNDKKAFQLSSLLMAEGFWRSVQEASGISPGYARSGRLQTLADDAALALARSRAEGARDHWGGRADWRIIPAHGLDWAPASPTGMLVHDTLSARLHPRRACAALAAAIEASGGSIETSGQLEGQVVWATGVAGLMEMSTALSRSPGGAVKGQAALLHFDARDAPQLFVDGIHIVPHEDGSVAVGSTSERIFKVPTSTDAQLDAILDRAMQALPVLHGARVVERWAGLRPRSRSRAPILGAHPLRKGQFIANGGFKIGFGMAPGVGEVIADLILDGIDRIPPGFRPEASL